jgi:hypothetical protein
MTSLLQHAKSELRAAGLFDDDSDYNGEIGVQVTALMETFCAYGHSGGSARQTLDTFVRLANHRSLTPLTGADDEWDDVTEMSGSPLWQNKRCPEVFKNETEAWLQISSNSRMPVTFPCQP